MSQDVSIDFELGFNSVTQSTDFVWTGVVTAHVSKDLRPLPFYVFANSESEDRSDGARDLWGQRLLNAAAGRSRLSAFELNDLTYYLRPMDENRGNRFTASISTEQFERFEEELRFVENVKHDFNHAVRCLRDFAESPPFHGYPGDEERMFSYLSECLFQAGCLGFMSGWYREKMSTIRRSMNEITRRKDQNHRGFKFAQDQMRTPLYMFEPPVAWITKPPLLNR